MPTDGSSTKSGLTILEVVLGVQPEIDHIVCRTQQKPRDCQRPWPEAKSGSPPPSPGMAKLPWTPKQSWHILMDRRKRRYAICLRGRLVPLLLSRLIASAVSRDEIDSGMAYTTCTVIGLFQVGGGTTSASTHANMPSTGRENSLLLAAPRSIASWKLLAVSRSLSLLLPKATVVHCASSTCSRFHLMFDRSSRSFLLVGRGRWFDAIIDFDMNLSWGLSLTDSSDCRSNYLFGFCWNGNSQFVIAIGNDSIRFRWRFEIESSVFESIKSIIRIRFWLAYCLFPPKFEISVGFPASRLSFFCEIVCDMTFFVVLVFFFRRPQNGANEIDFSLIFISGPS